jgi:hypothetical protein
MSQYPVSPKVQAASLTAAVSGAALWLLSHYVFRGSVPDGIASMVYIAVPGVLAYAAGWLAPHQPRPGHDLTDELITVKGHDLTDEQAAAFKAALENAVSPAGYPPQEERLDIKTEPGI